MEIDTEFIMGLFSVGLGFITMVLSGESSRKAGRMLQIIEVQNDLAQNEISFEKAMESGDPDRMKRSIRQLADLLHKLTELKYDQNKERLTSSFQPK